MVKEEVAEVLSDLHTISDRWNRTTGTGSDTLVLSMSEDAYQGDAQFTVSVDGKQLGGTFTATASHAAGASQSFTFNGSFGTGAHTVSVDFLNDAYGGSSATDRNLFTVSTPTAPSVSETGDHGSLAKNLSQTGIYTVGGDTFVLSTGNSASVILGSGSSQIAIALTSRLIRRRIARAANLRAVSRSRSSACPADTTSTRRAGRSPGAASAVP